MWEKGIRKLIQVLCTVVEHYRVSGCENRSGLVPTDCFCWVSSAALHPLLHPVLLLCLKESVHGVQPILQLPHPVFLSLEQGINSRCCVGCWVCSNPALRGKHPTRNARAPVTRRSCHREMGPLKSLCCPQPVNCYLNNSFPWGPGALQVAHSCQLC